MLKKLSLSVSFIGFLGAVAACGHAEDPRIQRAEIWQPKIEMPSSVVVCRSKQCAPAKLSMSKEYIYNSLMHLLDNNTQNKALICMADAASHVCTENYIQVPITVGVTPANMYIDAVKISDISATLGNKSLNLILNYDVTYNGQTPTCKPAQTLLYVKNANNIIMEDAGYACKMTTIGNTTIKTLFAIDYVDLDYGYIGGYYSLGLSGPAYGGGSGYMMLRLPNDAYPLTPNLMMSEPEPAPAAQPAQIAKDWQNTNVNKDSCTYKHNCSPALDKKMMIKEAPLPGEEPQSVSARLSSGKQYHGVEIFPLPPKNKSVAQPKADAADEKQTQSAPTTDLKAQPGEKLSEAVKEAVEGPAQDANQAKPSKASAQNITEKAQKSAASVKDSTKK